MNDSSYLEKVGSLPLFAALLTVTASACASATDAPVVAPKVPSSLNLEDLDFEGISADRILDVNPSVSEENLMKALRILVKKRAEEALGNGGKNTYLINCETGPYPTYSTNIAIVSARAHWSKSLNRRIEGVGIRIISSAVANSVGNATGYSRPAITCLATFASKIPLGMEI